MAYSTAVKYDIQKDLELANTLPEPQRFTAWQHIFLKWGFGKPADYSKAMEWLLLLTGK